MLAFDLSPGCSLIGLLAVWRVTHLVTLEDGPFDVIVWVRRHLGDGVLGRGMDCFRCMSLLLALPVAFWAAGVANRDGMTLSLDLLVLWPALSGGAMLLQSLVERSEKAANDNLKEP